MKTAALEPADLQILSCLQDDPRMPMAELAKKVNSSSSPCWRRVKRLEESGVIEGYGLTLNRKALGFSIDSFVFVKIASHHEREAGEFERALEEIEQIVSCHSLSGMDDYMLRVVATDLDSFSLFVRKVLAALPHVKEIRSSFVMHTIKETSRLPLQNC
jgi:Lrp/AsnC family transcriptional regulator, leucine-responsive regulatory protein